jgi:diketogulonate reductase-like aldo/keto reductase
MKHAATPYQIALAWLVNQPGVITIVLSHKVQHQSDNYAAGDIELSKTEMKRVAELK